MATVNINSNKRMGKIKPMHAINNGPTEKNSDDFLLVRFPYVRNHDASHYSGYGGSHTVDISAIFPDFNNDPYDEKSYDFAITDEYIKKTKEAGCDIFYRLGQSIEHTVKKYGANPPKDFKKWAVICEHIIRHYNEGWCDGFSWDIKYWEIWNEPDNPPACWTGTMEQFFELFEITAKHLKEKLPNIKVGGPALAEWSIDNDTVYNFVKYMSEKNVPLDFLSWHTYSRKIDDYLRRAGKVRRVLDEFGYKAAESILNEWNYLINWTDGLEKSMQKMREIEGACLVAAVMSASQSTSIDMLMHYDARPCAWNGLFDFYTFKRLKGFYPFLMFSRLYAIGEQVAAESDDEDIYAVAASDGEKAAAMVTYYTYDEDAKEKNVRINLGDDVKEYVISVLDGEKDAEKIGSFEMKSFELTLKPNSVVLLESK